MKWRWLAVPGGLLALAALLASLPTLGAQMIHQELRFNRQRLYDGIDTIRFAPPAGVRASELRINRQRITTILDDTPEPPLLAPAGIILPPGTVIAPPVVPGTAPPGVVVPPRAVVAPPVVPGAPPAPLVPKKVVVDPCDATVQPATLCIVRWSQCRGFIDDQGRRWQLIQGRPQQSQPGQMIGWLLTSDETSPLFYTRQGNLYRMMWQSRPLVSGGVK